jgi:hypothetical protein
MPELQREIFKEHLQKGKLHTDLHNHPTPDVSSSVHTYTHKKSNVFRILCLMFLQLKAF